MAMTRLVSLPGQFRRPLNRKLTSKHRQDSHGYRGLVSLVRLVSLWEGDHLQLCKRAHSADRDRLNSVPDCA
jgi:hypothetical protein